MADNLQSKVELALAPLNPLPIVVSVKKGVVLLEGTVVTERQRQHAEELARRVDGVRSIENHIQVEPAGLSPLDQPIAGLNRFETEVGEDIIGTSDARLAVESELDSTDYGGDGGDTVPYFPPTDPVVGQPGRNDEQELEVIGGFAPTAMDPEVDVSQRQAELRTDDVVEQDVIRELQEDAATTQMPLHVTVRHGVAHVHGQVQSIEDVQMIEEVISRVPGIVDVQDHLQIEGQ